MSYFSNLFSFSKQAFQENSNQLVINSRRFRRQIPGFERTPFWGFRFNAGDILKLSYDRGPVTFFFEGLCLCVRNKGFGRKHTSFLVRNILNAVGVEITIGYFLRRLYKLAFSDYKRKQFNFSKSRMYYVRGRINRLSRVS